MQISFTKSVALAAALSLSAVPAVPMAQPVCKPGQTPGEGGLCVCTAPMSLNPAGQCVQAEQVVVETGGTAGGPLPILSEIPPGAIIVGGLVILAGVVIGIAAANNDNENAVVTTTTTN